MVTHRPRARTAILVFVAYLVVFYGVWIVNGIDYAHIGDDASTILRWYVAPLAAGAVLLAVATTALGWWRPALFEVRRAPRWTLVTPVLMFLLAVVVLLQKDYSGTTGPMVALLVVGSVGVGFCEELATRGVLLVGLRDSFSEGRAWLWSSVLFGLLHLPNWVFGSGPSALVQVVLAFLSGTTFYLLRRGSGTLLLAMLLHGFWDFSTFIGDNRTLVNGLNVPIALGSVVVVLVLLRRERGEPSVASYAPAPQPAAG